MGWWSRRKQNRDETQEKDVDRLLAEAEKARPPQQAAAAWAGDGSFRMAVDDVFSITGRGTVVTGQVESGSVRVGMTLELVREGQPVASTPVTGLEMFRKVVDQATAGENVGLLLAGLRREDVQRGDVLTG